CAAGAEGMAEVALQRADGHVRAEYLVGGDGFGDVAAVGGGAVGADVADGGGVEVGVGERLAHDRRHGFDLRLGDVGTVRVGGEADQFGADGRATRLRVFEGFQHQGDG